MHPRGGEIGPGPPRSLSRHARPPINNLLPSRVLYDESHPLRHDQTLFLDIDVFDPTYLPLDLAHRDAQTGGLTIALPGQGFHMQLR